MGDPFALDFFAPWHANSICVIDFESTGPDPELCLPVQVAAVRFEPDGRRSGSACFLVNPGVPIPAEASEVHGIIDADVQDAPEVGKGEAWLRVVAEVEALTYGAMVAAYNEPFDRTIAGRVGFNLNEPWLDPLVMVWKADRYVGGKGRHKLETTCERWGIPFEGAHDALADADATGRLMQSDRMRSILGDLTYPEVIRRQRIHAAEKEADFQAWLAKQPPKEPAPITDRSTGREVGQAHLPVEAAQ